MQLAPLIVLSSRLLLHLQSSILYPPSSILYPLSSILYPLSSILLLSLLLPPLQSSLEPACQERQRVAHEQVQDARQRGHFEKEPGALGAHRVLLRELFDRNH